MSAQRSQPVSLTDIESKLREIDDSVRGKVADRRQTIITGAIVSGLLILLIAYFFGRRSGKKKTTFVEIRRL
jgi:hypothetical protein